MATQKEDPPMIGGLLLVPGSPTKKDMLDSMYDVKRLTFTIIRRARAPLTIDAILTMAKRLDSMGHHFAFEAMIFVPVKDVVPPHRTLRELSYMGARGTHYTAEVASHKGMSPEDSGFRMGKIVVPLVAYNRIKLLP